METGKVKKAPTNWRRIARESWQNLIGILVISAVFYILSRLFGEAIKPENRDAIMIVVGNVMTWAGLVVGYFYGSSKGSADKSDMNDKNNTPPGV